MAQSGYTPIQLYYSTTAAAVPTSGNLANGELGINITDGKLYYKNNSGVVTLLASSTTVTNSFSAGTTGFTPSTATTGAVTLAGTLVVGNGGTGLTTLATGSLSYGAGTSAFSTLAIGTAGQILTVNSGATAPQWSTLSGVAVTTFSAGTTGFTPSSATAGAVTLAGTLATTNGGTGLTSFTSGGVVYASSTSALATGSALTFNGTKLATTGYLNASGMGIFQGSLSTFDAASGGLYAYYSGGGVIASYSDNSGTLAQLITSGSVLLWRTGGTEKMRLDASGNLGINTSSPTTKLNISGSSNTLLLNGSGTGTNYARFTSTGGDSVVGLEGSTASTICTGSLAYSTLLYTVGSTALQLGTNSTVRATIDTSGNVGIGTTSPSSKFVVSNAGAAGLEVNPTGVASSPVIISYNRSGAAYTQLTYLALQHVWQNSGTEGMRLDTTGLGIGTNAPTTSLSVVNATSGVKADFVQNSTTAGDYTGVSFGVTSSSVTGYKKGGVFFERTGAGGTGKLHLANNPLTDASNVSLTDVKLTVDSTGYVGIATTSPGSALDVKGTLRLSGSSSGYVGFAPAAAAGSTTYTLPSADGTSGQFLSTNGSGTLSWATGGGGGSSQWTTSGSNIYYSTGNVGIGSSSANNTLSLYNATTPVLQLGNSTTTVNSGSGLQLYITASDSTIYNQNSGYLRFGTAGSERMRIDSSGYVGIGTTVTALTSGTAQLAVVNSSALTKAFIGSSSAFSSGNSGGQLSLGKVNGSELREFGMIEGSPSDPTSGADGYLAFKVRSSESTTERMRITSAGYVGIKTTSPTSNLQVFAQFSGISTPSTSSLRLYYSSTYFTEYTEYTIQCFNNPFQVMSGTTGGVQLTSGATSWSAISDARLKNVTGTYTNALSDIAQIEPVKFTWKYDPENKPQVGVIAQSVLSVVPEAVDLETKTKSGVPVDEQYYSVRYTELIPLMIASIQELKTQNELLKARLDAANL